MELLCGATHNSFITWLTIISIKHLILIPVEVSSRVLKSSKNNIRINNTIVTEQIIAKNA